MPRLEAYPLSLTGNTKQNNTKETTICPKKEWDEVKDLFSPTPVFVAYSVIAFFTNMVIVTQTY